LILDDCGPLKVAVRRDHLAETTGDEVESIAKYVKKTKEDPNTGSCD